MTKKIFKTIATLLLIAGGIVVVTDAFGTSTANQYLFNFFYLVLLMPACIGLWFKVDGHFKCLTR